MGNGDINDGKNGERIMRRGVRDTQRLAGVTCLIEKGEGHAGGLNELNSFDLRVEPILQNRMESIS